MDKKDVPIKHLFSIPLLSAPKVEVMQLLVERVESNQQKAVSLVFTPNPEQMTLSFHDKKFVSTLRESTWNLPDGQGIAWALSREGEKVTRIPGREVFHDLLQVAVKKKWSVFLLGGRSGSAEAVAHKYGDLWSYDQGAVDIAHETELEERWVIEKISKTRPQLLFVAYGAPWQERWLVQHANQLTRAGVRLAMVVGGAFEYEAGIVAHVPPLLEHLHLEWLWRLILEPWRWKRQLRGLEFFWRVLFRIPAR